MQLLNCTAAGATFAVATAQLPPQASAQTALSHWRRSTLAHLNAADVAPLAAASAGAITTRGTRPGGGAVALAAQWVAHGQQVVQIAIYVDNPEGKPVQALFKTELHDAFFEGLRFQP